jgi:predicted CXXCH cytochrome family protein
MKVKTGPKFIIMGMSALVVFLWAFRSPSVKDNQQETTQPLIIKGIENNLFADENESCLRCHGEVKYELTDTLSGMTVRRAMSSSYFIERDEFYHSVHWSFNCLDCHQPGYSEYPHSLDMKFEPPYMCLDCHGYDETYARYKFEDIETEHIKSAHYTLTDGDFSCWSCHDPHTYQVLARENMDIAAVVRNSNNMCLVCHGDPLKFGLVSDKEPTEVIETHDWLPNQRLHFSAVRCIDCHTEINDSLLVSHNMRPADEAVKDCVSCHSGNSILMGTLYKYQSKESRKQLGFINAAIISNNSYVVGANRSRLMNIGSLLIFGLTLGVVLVHTFFRILNSKKTHHE